MTATFTKTKLAGDTYLVEGTDSTGTEGQIQVWGREYDELKGDDALGEAKEKFNEALSEFLKPINEAADELRSAKEKAALPLSEEFYIVTDAVEAVAGQAKEIKQLSQDTVILRLIDAGKFDRLRWVNGAIAITQ